MKKLNKNHQFGIIGHFGGNKNFTDGQTVKTKEINEYLEKYYGIEIKKFDTYKNAKNPFKLLVGILKIVKNSDFVLVILSNRGYKIVTPIVYFLNIFYKRKIYDFVIGGNRQNIFIRKKILKHMAYKTTKIYVETESMKKSYNQLGFKNVEVFPNFKKLQIANIPKFQKKQKIKVCTFTRVCKEKGIKEAIDSVVLANKILGEDIFYLDIYGSFSLEYEKEFKKMLFEAPNYITYKGVVNSSESVNILKEYDIMLFLTYWNGEGFPGTIIDAFFSGLPVIATNWNSNSEILTNNTGFIVNIDENEIQSVADLLIYNYKNQKELYLMKGKCIETALKYNPDNIMRKFINEINK